jgi:hypothetical protein
MLQQCFAKTQNYALILLLFALLAYSLIGFGIDVSAAQAEELSLEHTELSAQVLSEQKSGQPASIGARLPSP